VSDDRETEHQRLNRELIELLNELRVALPGVQVLFAFLLTVPFTQRFEELSDGDRAAYYATVLLTATSSVLLMAPSAHHRMRFRQHAKEQMLHAANAFAVVGLILLALAIGGALYLVGSVIYGSTLVALVAAVFGVLTVAFWFVAPLVIYPKQPPPEESEPLLPDESSG
jgi:hypothetical protein